MNTKITFAIPVLLGFILSSCGKKSKQCSVSKPEKTIILAVAQKEATYNVWTGATRDNSDMRFSFMKTSSPFDNSAIVNAINFYGFPSFESNLFKVVLLADINPQQIDKESLPANKVRGLITYTLIEEENVLKLRV